MVKLMLTFLILFIKFIIYSFLGYIAECIFVSAENKKFTNRGFLCGPICPIYGVGGVFMSLLLKKYHGDLIATFVLGALLATIIEYFTGFLLEKLFHNKWWDYSKHKFNLNGRVCLMNTILFGICAVLVVNVFSPMLNKVLSLIPNAYIIIISIILIILFVLDMIYSWIVAFNLRGNIIVVEDLKNEKINDLPDLLEKKLKHELKKLKRIPKRIQNAFPIFIRNYKIEFDIINKLKKKSKKKKK